LTRKALVGLSLSLSRKRNAPPTDAHVFLAREIARVRLAFTSRRFAFLQSSSKKNKKTLSQRDYDSLSREKLVDCVQNPQQKRDTKNKTKKKSFPKSTLAKHHATVRAPLRLFGQFRLEHEIVPLHFLYIYMFELI